MEEPRIRHLFQHYLDDQLSPAELDELLLHFGVADDSPLLRKLIDEALEKDPDLHSHPTERAAIARHLDQRIIEQTRPARKQHRRWLPYAAAVLLMVAAATLYLYLGKPAAIPIPPGGNRATLTLADGKVVTLDSTQSGIIMNTEDITYNDGTKISAPIHHSSLITYNSLTTPKGGQYQVMLEDGTKIWLNAQSTLKYPSKFVGNNREVEISGEAFFAVKSDPSRTFTVKSDGQSIDILGTSFNVASYQEEHVVKTTLLDGSVRVNSGNQSRILIPGQQSALRGSRLTVQKVDTETVTAWKDNMFMFKNETLGNIMKQVARWYDVQVEYRGVDEGTLLWGSVSRFENMSKVLEILELTGTVHFKMEGRKVIAYK